MSNSLRPKNHAGGGVRSRLTRHSRKFALAAALLLGVAALPFVAQANPFAGTSPFADPSDATESVYDKHVVQNTVDPRGTTINLFDYWDTEDHRTGGDYTGTDTAAKLSTARYEGINVAADGAHHQLEFNEGAHGQAVSINASSEGAKAGMVEPTLTNGYPVLAQGAHNAAGQNYKDGEALDIKQESLAYVFNEYDVNSADSNKVAGKQAYSDVSGLLQQDQDGYYYYDSTQNFASYDDASNAFKVYDAAAVHPNGKTDFGQFFPFNTASEVFNQEEKDGNLDPSAIKSTSKETINHWFGLSMTTDFAQLNGGKTSNSKDMVYQFSGDDDVWIYIDGVLVGDCGGIHSAHSVDINFATGKVVVKRVDNPGQYTAETTIKKMFEAAGRSTESGFRGDTFADNTMHTLKFFYLERGSWDSNLSLRFNLTAVPESGVKKIDEQGKGIAGVGFDLYATEENYEVAQDAKPIATGVTERDGEMAFHDPTSGTPMTFTHIYSASGNKTHYVLRETNTPQGYRSAGDIKVGYDAAAGVAYCDNPWETGAIATASEVLNAPTELKLATESDYAANQTFDKTLNADSSELTGVGDVPGGGTLFATVLHKHESNWNAVYGTGKNGDWDATTSTGLAAAVEVARKVGGDATGEQKGAWKFEWNNTAWSTKIDELPGRIAEYRTIGNNGKEDFMVAVYYSTAKNLADVDVNNTYIVQTFNDENNTMPAQFNRLFSATFSVPNVGAYLAVQKVDDQGNPVSATSDEKKATFALYNKGDVTIDDDGVVTIPDNAQPVQTATTKNMKVDDGDPVTADGIALFSGIDPGDAGKDYVLVETKAPQGYELNPHASRVHVDHSGLYTHAGSANDGISASRDLGLLVPTMREYARDTTLDGTLTYVTAQLQTSKNNDCPTNENVWQDVSGASRVLKYDNNTFMYKNADAKDASAADPFAVEEGWARLLVKQAASYPNWTKGVELKDTKLNQLFLISALVQVADKPVGDLEISKTVADYKSMPDSLKQTGFTFTVKASTVTTPEGSSKPTSKPLEGTYSILDAKGQPMKDADGKAIELKGGTATFSLKHDEKVVIKNLPTGTAYTVTETDPGVYFTTSATKDGTAVDLANGLTVSGMIAKEAGTVAKVAFTNTYQQNPSAHIELEKQFKFAGSEESAWGTLAESQGFKMQLEGLWEESKDANGQPLADANALPMPEGADYKGRRYEQDIKALRAPAACNSRGLGRQ